jgi:bacillithiol biosynthesis cysteine-adding enzyme BshC
MSSAFSAAFLRGEARATALLPDDFRHAARRAENVRRAATRAVSAKTLAALRAQSARLPASSAREAHLQALSQPGTVAVVTGQQVGLFLGPLYSLYKAASAVIVARTLQQETGVRCVPVFWLQSEDHDFEEIDHCDVSAALRVRLQARARVEKSSLSSLMLGEDVEVALRALSEGLEGPHADEVMALFRRHYRADNTWVNAFAGVMAELLDELVFVDPRDEALAEELRPVHQRALRESTQIAEALLERSATLEREGFATQVHVRAGAPLSFFHPEGRQGPRFRLDARSGSWGLVGREDSRTTEELLSTRDPLCFSTSALLRPIVQDSLLPTAAYVGGPGELNYFSQLPPLYSHFGLPLPMFVPRARFRVIDARTKSLLQKLGLSAAEVESPELAKRLASSSGVSPASVEKQLVEAVAPILDSLPAELADAVKRTRGTIARAASRLSGRYARSLQIVDQTLSDRVIRLQAALFPHGEPQERVLGVPAFAARFGVREFVSLVLGALEPFGGEVKELFP